MIGKQHQVHRKVGGTDTCCPEQIARYAEGFVLAGPDYPDLHVGHLNP